MEQEQNQQKSSIDRTNDLFNNARGVYRKGKSIKKAVQAIRVTRSIAAVGQGLGLGGIIGIILFSLFLATFLLVFIGGGAVTGTENEEPEPIDTNVCSEVEIPGLTCYVNAPSHVENGQSYNYEVGGNYKTREGGRELSSFILKLTIPSEIIEFTTNLPGNYDTEINGARTTYTWLLTDPVNFSLFEPVGESSPPDEYSFYFSVTARPKPEIENTIATVEFLIE